MSQRFDGRLAVVTGATRGLGYHTALALASEGATVIAIGRKAEALEALDDAGRAAGASSMTLVPLDLTDGQGLDRLGGAIAERWGKLDILVGCAASLGPLAPVPHIEAPSWSAAMDVNASANWRLLRTLHPVLRQADGARVVMVTCRAAREIKSGWAAFAASKRALEVLTETYAREVDDTTIRANLFDPGVMGTGLRATAAPGDTLQDLPHPRDIAPRLLALCLPGCDTNGTLHAA